jgi:2-polyprenyl-3-methyl-5-hydroxy-6-metoxy-1,4-benzoquinol methylase
MLRELKVMIATRANRGNIYDKAAYWNQKAIDYEGSAVSMWKNHALNALYEREQFDFVDRVLGDVRGASILDLGCGTGRLSRHLARRGARMTAFDFAEEPIKIARSLSPQADINYAVRSIFDIDEVEAYDCAVAIGNITVACKTEADVRTVLSLLRRALKLNGKLVFIEPFHDTFLKRVLAISAKDFLRILEASGFRLQMHRELHFWPARLPLSLADFPKPVTALGYYLGQAMMALGGQSLGLGDYKGIAAVRVD